MRFYERPSNDEKMFFHLAVLRDRTVRIGTYIRPGNSVRLSKFQIWT